MSEIIKINRLEVASELAHAKLENEWRESVQIYVDENAEELRYTEEAQDIFNCIYDTYLDFLDEYKVD